MFTEKDVDRVWLPETFGRNEEESKTHQEQVQNSYVRVFPGGDLLHSVRVSLTTLPQLAL